MLDCSQPGSTLSLRCYRSYSSVIKWKKDFIELTLVLRRERDKHKLFKLQIAEKHEEPLNTTTAADVVLTAAMHITTTTAT